MALYTKTLPAAFRRSFWARNTWRPQAYTMQNLAHGLGFSCTMLGKQLFHKGVGLPSTYAAAAGTSTTWLGKFATGYGPATSQLIFHFVLAPGGTSGTDPKVRCVVNGTNSPYLRSSSAATDTAADIDDPGNWTIAIMSLAAAPATDYTLAVELEDYARLVSLTVRENKLPVIPTSPLLGMPHKAAFSSGEQVLRSYYEMIQSAASRQWARNGAPLLSWSRNHVASTGPSVTATSATDILAPFNVHPTGRYVSSSTPSIPCRMRVYADRTAGSSTGTCTLYNSSQSTTDCTVTLSNGAWAEAYGAILAGGDVSCKFQVTCGDGSTTWRIAAIHLEPYEP